MNFSGNPKNLTASGVVSAQPCKMIGFYVNSTSSGTIVFKDGGTSGTAITGTITPAVGWHFFPADFAVSAYATIGGTLNATFIYQPV